MADLNIAAAAVRLGISKQAMRTRVRRGQVTAHKSVDGSWLVTVPDDAPDTSSPPSDVLQDASNDTPDADHDVPRWRPYDADAVIAILREQLAIKDRQISELHVMLQTAQRMLPATVPDAAQARERAADDESHVEANVAPEGAQREPEASWRVRLRRLMGLG